MRLQRLTSEGAVREDANRGVVASWQPARYIRRSGLLVAIRVQWRPLVRIGIGLLMRRSWWQIYLDSFTRTATNGQLRKLRTYHKEKNFSTSMQPSTVAAAKRACVSSCSSATRSMSASCLTALRFRSGSARSLPLSPPD